MGETPIYSRPPEVSFLTSKIPPPAPLYIAREEGLQVVIWNSAANADVYVYSRLLRPDGVIQVSIEPMAPTSDRVYHYEFLQLGEGFLLSVMVGTGTYVPRRGQTYAIVRLARPGDGGHIPYQVLIADYLEDAALLTWPPGVHRSSIEGPGYLQSITGTDPAAGAEITETVPTNARWKLQMVTFQLVTSSTVATRDVRFVIDDGTNALLVSGPNVTQAASLTYRYTAGLFGTIGAATPADFMIPLPNPLLLFQGWRLRTSTGSMQTGDNYGPPQLLVEEWIEE